MKTFTLLALIITFSMNAQMDDNSANNNLKGGTIRSNGKCTIASGNNSTAMGYFTTASGNKTTAMGANTTASDYASLVIGQFNSSGSSVTKIMLLHIIQQTQLCDWKWYRFLKQIRCF